MGYLINDESKARMALLKIELQGRRCAECPNALGCEGICPKALRTLGNRVMADAQAMRPVRRFLGYRGE